MNVDKNRLGACDAPTHRDLAWIAGAAIGVRVLLAVANMAYLHVGLTQFANFADAPSYENYAGVIAGDVRIEDVDRHDLRFFPGLPAMMAGLHLLGLSLPMSGLAISWVGAALAAVLSAALTRDRRIGLAVALVMPEFVRYTSVIGTEGPVLALTLAGLWLALRCRPWLGGAVFGLAATVRPVACFAVAGFVVYCLLNGRKRSAIIVGLMSASVVGAAMLLLHVYLGSAMAGVKIYANDPRDYAGQLFSWPFESVIMTPWRRANIPVAKIVWVWAHLGAILAICVLAAKKFFRAERETWDALALPWLWGNTAFVLCVGYTWGFECFTRFLMPALTPAFWVLRGYLPRRGWIWLLLGVGCWIMAFAFSLRNV